MSRAHGTLEVFGLTLAVASLALYIGCGGGSGDVTGPPGGGGAGAVDSLVLSVDSADVIVGDTIRIVAEARDANGQVVPGIRLSFSTSDPAVATVTEDGLVTAVDFGEAEIGVEIAGEANLGSASLAPSYSAVMLSNRSTFRMRGVPSVVITPGEQTLDPGVTSQYSASVTNVRGQGLTRVRLIWSSSDPSIAGIDATGLVTTQNEGDTDIRLTVTAGDGVSTPLQVTTRVPLHVAVCGGIFRVPSWTGAIDVEYQAGGHDPAARATYAVDQFTTSPVVLEKDPEPSSDGSVVWEGKTSGSSDLTQVHLNNVLTFPVPPPVNTGRTEEIKNGAVQDGSSAIARLKVKKSSDGSSCIYDLRWGDYFTWSVTNNQGAPPIPKAGPTGSALLVGKDVGTPPTDGHWVLGGLTAADAVRLPATAFPAPATSYYVPGTMIGGSMIIALGGASASYMEAKMSYILQGHVQ
jgi:hypothetical protein